MRTTLRYSWDSRLPRAKPLRTLTTQALNEISEAAREQVDFINVSISNLRTSLELTSDPTEIQQILEAIRVLVGATV